MEKKDNNQSRDNQQETKKGLKEINKIIFLPNEDVPDNWVDFELSAEEVRILKEGEDYIDKVVAPSLSIYRKVSKEELMDNERPPKEIEQTQENIELNSAKEAKQSTLNQQEIEEIDMLLKSKAKTLGLKKQDEIDKEKRLTMSEEERKKKEEIERLNR